MELTTGNTPHTKNVKCDAESAVGIMRIMRFGAELTLDKIEHCSFASRARHNNNARIPALQRNIRPKFKIISHREIELLLELGNKNHNSII